VTSAAAKTPETPRVRDLDWLLVPVLVLCCIGIVMAVSIRGVDPSVTPMGAVKAQGGRVAIGLLGFLFFAVVPLRRLDRHVGWMFGLCVLACFATHLFGGTKGAARWIDLGSFRFQPVEPARFCLVLLGASLLSRQSADEGAFWRRLPHIAFLGAAAVLCVALLLQPDHGNTLFTAAVVGLLCLVAGVPVWQLVVGGALAATGVVLKGMDHDYAVDRVRGFLEIEAGSQVGQGLVALSSGGVFGRGLGEGGMKMGFVSEARNDFVFTIIGEELGFAGAITVVALFTAIGIAGYRLVRGMQDPYLRLLVVGFVLVLCLQAGINMLVNVGWAPAKGIDLPFVSSGGTSLLFCLASVGVIGNAARADARDNQ